MVQALPEPFNPLLRLNDTLVSTEELAKWRLQLETRRLHRHQERQQQKQPRKEQKLVAGTGTSPIMPSSTSFRSNSRFCGCVKGQKRQPTYLPTYLFTDRPTLVRLNATCTGLKNKVIFYFLTLTTFSFR